AEAWFDKASDSTHAYFTHNPSTWQSYHATFRQARQSWEQTPADEMVRLYDRGDRLVIGDFGCGEGMIGQALAARHTVHGFDHVAANSQVTACDIAHVPLAKASLDVAIFSLALMGNNFTSYLHEAHRTLRQGGTLHIVEMTRRFTDVEGFVAGLQAMGFSVKTCEPMWKFTHIVATKSSDLLLSDAPVIF
ncbi:MAG: methyltransferase domain-containing protein, partial [Deltaproteobacteria bacterium]